MPSVQIKNVPEQTHATPRRRAAAAGRSLHSPTTVPTGTSRGRDCGGSPSSRPGLIVLETASVIRHRLRDEQLDQRRAELALAAYPWAASHVPLLRRSWELRNNLTIYEAAYVALAELLEGRADHRRCAAGAPREAAATAWGWAERSPRLPTMSASVEAATPERNLSVVQRVGTEIAANVRRALEVRDEVVELMLIALIARGHVLIEDRPGVGKTALARALARSIRAEFSRIQCTADLLPADVVGSMVFNQRETRFEFHSGPVFANVVLVDEINRASPKTQSGLLEAMQERGVTVEGETHELARPFLIVATQNPVEFAGTYPLPEAQLDRFMARVALGYPDAAAEAEMLAAHAGGDLVVDLEPVIELEDVLAAQDAAAAVHGSAALRRYVVALVAATRSDPRVELGASPRAALMLFQAGMARAALRGRDHVLPDDIQALADSVLSHRLLLAPGSGDGQRSTVVADAIASVPAL